MKPPAIISLLAPKNLRVIEAFVRQHPGTTVLIPASMPLPQPLRERITAAGSYVVTLDSLVDEAQRQQIYGAVAERKEQLVPALADPAWSRRWQSAGVAPAVLGNILAEVAAVHLPILLALLAGLQQAAVQYELRLVVVNEDLTAVPRTLVDWARRRGIPSLHLSHSLLLCEPYTVHAQVHADVTAVFGERGVDSYKDVGISPSRLRVTGSPAWDDYAQLVPHRAQIRDELFAQHCLSPEVPVVMFGTVWSASLTALDDEGQYGNTLRDFLTACKKLLDGGVALQAVIKDRPGVPESGPRRVQQLIAELALPASSVRHVLGEAMPWVLSADVVVSVQSNLSVEAMLAGVPAINLGTELGMALGPSFAADAGIVEAEDSELAAAIEALVRRPALRAQKLAAMQRAAAYHNAGVDGRASERFVALMNELALPSSQTSSGLRAA